MSRQTTLVLGGAASGKSAYAESLVEAHDGPLTYIASAQAYDPEMEAKIRIHTERRGPRWRTVEAPLDVAAALAQLTQADCCLFDCATLWVSNHLLNGSDLATEQAALLTAISNCPAPLVIVTNEVGHGIVPDNALARQFREAQGRLNIALAAQADTVVQVIAGLPQVLK